MVGAWGVGIFDDDTAGDVRAEFQKLVEVGLGPGDAVGRLMREYREGLADPDDGPVVCLALACLLLDAGVSGHPLTAEARRIIEQGVGLERWEEAGPEVLAARRAVYEDLLTKLTPANDQ